MAIDLYDRHGHRKYLNPAERQDFLRAAAGTIPEVHTFCGTLAYGGCRISEALALTADRVDIREGVLVFESLKKRRKGIFRAVPVPPDFLATLDLVHDLGTLQRRSDRGLGIRLWAWSRPTAWRRVSEVMEEAGIAGLHATPKGLRHGFGIKAVTSEVPLNMTQK
jgi:integrase/recombinase XerD